MTTVLNTNPAAQEQAAMHRTELLLARCRNCIPCGTPGANGQTRWHAQRQADFLAWLDAGGFAQSAPERQEPEPAGHAPRDGAAVQESPADVAPAMLRCAQ